MEEQIIWPNEENCKHLQEMDAKFIFDQAEKVLKESTDSSQVIVNRTTTLATITVGLMIALIGYLINRLKSVESIFEAETVTAITTIIYLFFLCKSIIKNIEGKDYSIIGAEPKNLFVDLFFKKEDGDTQEEHNKKRIIHFYYNEIVNLQKRIDQNKKTNNDRWKLFNRSLYNLLYTPIVILGTFACVKCLTFIIRTF